MSSTALLISLSTVGVVGLFGVFTRYLADVRRDRFEKQKFEAEIQFKQETQFQEFRLRRQELEQGENLRDAQTSSEHAVISELMSQLMALEVRMARFEESSREALPLDAPADSLPKSGGSLGTSTYQIVSELAHSIKTPLAHLDATLSLMLRTSEVEGEARGEIEGMLESVEICKATISAFSELTKVSGASASWQPNSLPTALRSAHRLYNRSAGAATELQADLPESLQGLSNNLVLSMILPLLENAVEASPQGGTVTLNHRHDDGYHRITLENDTRYPPDMTLVHKVGGSDKEGHQGLGVSVANRLATSLPGGEMRVTATLNHFVAELSLPGRS